MPRIRCHYLDCVLNDDGICSASAIELDPDTGCLTYSQANKLMGGDWEDEDQDLDEDWEEMGFEDEGEDDWLDDEDDEFDIAGDLSG